MTEPSREPLPEAPVVPLEYAGLWLAWNRDLTRIIASGTTIDEAHDAAVAAGEPRPVLGKAPRADVLATGLLHFDAFPVHDVGPWPEGLSLRREDMYGDDGR
jgi:hypothetical protein